MLSFVEMAPGASDAVQLVVATILIFGAASVLAGILYSRTIGN